MNIKKIKKGIKKPSLLVFHSCVRLSKLIPSDQLYLKILYRASVGKKLDFAHPVTFTQKIQWLKLHNTSDLCTLLVDKYNVREWIKSKIGEEYLIPCYGIWNHFDNIDFTQIPNQFVLKTTHDSGSVVICKNKENFDYKSAKKKLEKSLKRNYFWKGREYPYKNVPPRIIAEKYMENEDGTDIVDYKFFCFNGEPKVMFYASERFNAQNEPPKFDYYDMNLNHMPIQSCGHDNLNTLSYFPEFEIMKQLAAELSKGFPHIRVDFYLIDGKIFFGEMTFHHDGGFVSFIPEEWDKTFGDMIDLTNYPV